jgi:hypothetical protein
MSGRPTQPTGLERAGTQQTGTQQTGTEQTPRWVRSEVRWMSPSSGTWRATRRGEPVGTVERVEGSYRATSARGRGLGVFDDLDSARAVIDRRAERPAVAPARVSVVTAVLWGVIGGAATVALVLVVALFRTGG